jgi:thioesterase domain-containing protein
MNAAIVRSEPHCEMVGVLTPIWERVLARSSIRPTDNFFDLGGDSLLAVTLLLEVERNMLRKLSFKALYEAPTISGMAALLYNHPRVESSPLVLLKSGDKRPALFIAATFSIATRITSHRPVYLLQWTDRPEEPRFSDVGKVAQVYLSAIDKVQPKGPYLLAGYCFDGFIMFEIAHRLLERGDDIAKLVLLDTYVDLPFGFKVAAWRIAFHLLTLRTIPIGQAVSFLAGRYTALLRRLRARRKAHRAPSATAPLNTQPRYFQGRLTLVQSESVQSQYPGANQRWSQFAQSLEVHKVACDHLQMITTHADEVARCLSGIFSDNMLSD